MSQSPDPTICKEVLRPEWRSGKRLAKCLPEADVRTAICSNLKTEIGNVNLVITDDQYNQLLEDIRIVDLGNYSYWFLMLVFAFIFLVIEFLITHLSKFPDTIAPVIEFYKTLTLILGVCSFIFLLIYMIGLVKMATEKPMTTKKIPPSVLHALPALFISVGIVLINLWLVANTGWRDSPFVPMLFAVAIFIVGLPRENSWLPIVSSVIAIVTVCAVFGFSEEEISKLWLGNAVAIPLNISSFVLPATFSILIRFVSSYKPGL